MEPTYWTAKWERNDLGFHQSDHNALMVAHFGALDLQPGAHVFVPLCGKSRDMLWLRAQGFHVTGAELSEIAVAQFFEENGLTAEISQQGPLRRYSADGLELYAGDIFDLSEDILGHTDASYDRAALVALPDDLRARYAEHLHKITAGAPQLLLTFDYDQSKMNGPPFSVGRDAVQAAHGPRYQITELDRRRVAGKLKGEVDAMEVAWLLR